MGLWKSSVRSGNYCRLHDGVSQGYWEVTPAIFTNEASSWAGDIRIWEGLNSEMENRPLPYRVQKVHCWEGKLGSERDTCTSLVTPSLSQLTVVRRQLRERHWGVQLLAVHSGHNIKEERGQPQYCCAAPPYGTGIFLPFEWGMFCTAAVEIMTKLTAAPGPGTQPL